jgi:hypothetical protein
LKEINTEELREKCVTLQTAYQEDIDDCLYDEILQFRGMGLADVGKEGESIELSMFRAITNSGLESCFPNFALVLRIYLSLMVANCTGERSFSHLKRIKNYLRSTMSQERLNCLAALNIENSIVCHIDFHDLVKDFASKKCRKVRL